MEGPHVKIPLQFLREMIEYFENKAHLPQSFRDVQPYVSILGSFKVEQSDPVPEEPPPKDPPKK